MRNRSVSISKVACGIVATLFLSGVSMSAQYLTPSSRGFMQIDEIKAGMKGTASTVFKGSEPTQFDVEILGVVPGMVGPKQDMILCRISGGETDRTFVFAGMSGSPVVVDGKLVGAIAYAFPFSKEPICGITPIGQMIESFGGTPESPRVSAKAVSRQDIYPEIGSSDAGLNIFGGVTVTRQASEPLSDLSGGTFRPIATPISFSGISQATLDLFSREISSAGLVPVSAPAGSAVVGGVKTSDSQTLSGGKSITVLLARGDYTLAASGTVTLRDGNRIYAFGHKFLAIGGTDAPMLESSVVGVVPSLNNSFKVTVPGEMVGAISQDRQLGVLGTLGATPKMIPVSIRFKNSLGRSAEYKFEMVTDEFLSPLLLNIGAANAILANERSIGELTIELSSKIILESGKEMSVSRRTSGQSAVPAASLSVAMPLSTLLSSRFEGASVKEIKVELAAREGKDEGVIARVVTDRQDVRAGDSVRVTTVIEGAGGRETRQEFNVTVPKDTPEGELTFTVADGASIEREVLSDKVQTADIDELLAFVNGMRRGDNLYLQVSRASLGATVGGKRMSDLPPSVVATLENGRSPEKVKATDKKIVFEQILPRTDILSSGKQTATVRVIR